MKKQIKIKQQTIDRQIKAKKNQELKEDTERKIMKLRMKGIPRSVIAEAMNLSERMVDKHISDAKKKQSQWLDSQIEKFDLKSFWMDRIEAQKSLIHDLWSHFDEADVRDRANLSSKLMDAYNELEEIYRKAGLKVTDQTLVDDGIQGIQIVFKNTKDNVNPFHKRTQIMLDRRKNKIENNNQEDE